jgi:class 3 adenylate cyclase
MDDFEGLGLNELIRLQARISEVLTRRFERPMAVVFSDVVGSSGYTAKHGDEAGRMMQQRHIDLVSRATGDHRGRIVDTAGDGAFCVFESVTDAIEGLSALHREVLGAFAIRTAVHHGRVLTDGVAVSGDAVNFCARVVSSAAPGEIRLTRAAFHELESGERARCRALPLIALKDYGEGVPVFAYEWRDLARFPIAVRVVETGTELAIPNQEVVSIGRLRLNPNGSPANDLVIALPDADKAVLLSRWHLELRRRAEGMVARSVSDRSVELNGRALIKGADAEIRVGDVLRLSGVVSLELLGESLSRSALSTRGGP